ncbi:GNAT family N-acetyltransferase [Mucisphaera sp.]|uniref:GNAT family N-acetyltransferase n=1 Tax=Mucisphaera sp. TaxID=2913024 RepID=UPI003D1388F4
MAAVTQPDSHLRIAPANLDDPAEAQALLELIEAYAREPIGLGRALDRGVRAVLIDRLRAHPATEAHLCRLGPEPVGYAITLLSFSTFKAASVLNIHDLAVLSGHRGRGVGRAILDYLHERACQSGCCKLTLEVREDNPAQRLYRRAGFGPGDANEHFWTKWCRNEP